MTISRNKLYMLLGIALIVGYAWLFLETTHSRQAGDATPEICIFKNLTGIPCPSCGSTRSVVCLLHGDPLKAININPLGIPVFLIMLFSPAWLLFDLIFRKESFHRFYCRTEILLRKLPVAITLTALVIANWIWSITKAI
jgi:nitrogen fixation-related uncharacterized protein